jgi:DNA sulfur modification protein DndB
MDTEPTLSFPVIRGIQACREYYVAMWSLRMIRQISIFNEDDLPPELRSQRILNKELIPEMAGYILENPDDYVFSALTVSIDSQVEFESIDSHNTVGILKVPMDARFIINDGQHRRAAIIAALEQRPELAHECIAVVFHVDDGLERCQQMFTDLSCWSRRWKKEINSCWNCCSQTPAGYFPPQVF